LAAQAMARGWEVMGFSRGRSGAPLPGVEHVQGDRMVASDLERLASLGAWDATVDTSAYEPGDVVRAVDVLGAGAGRYVLVSTVSAYRDWPGAAVDEDCALWPSRLDASESDEDVAALPAPFQYGTLKAGCELAAGTAAGGTLIVRPGVILGPGEYVGRMLSLLGRAAAGGRWLVPAPAAQPIQPVDVRDVAAFILDGIAAGLDGAFNLTAPAGFATYGDLIAACVAVTGGGAQPVWVDPQWLIAQGVRQWTEVPLWRVAAGTWAVDARRATRAGLRCRPLVETVRDTWDDFQAHPPVAHPRQAEHGMAPGREADLLRRWDEGARSRLG
jgi:2'-hydroxyisoflavone reductase